MDDDPRTPKSPSPATRVRPLLPLAVAGMAILAVIGAGAHGALRLSDHGPLAGERGPILGIGILLIVADVLAIAAVHAVMRRRRRRRLPDDDPRFQEPIEPDVRWMRLVQLVAIALALLLPILLLVLALRPRTPARERKDRAIRLPALHTPDVISGAALWTLVWLAVAVVVVWTFVVFRRMARAARRPPIGPGIDEEDLEDAEGGDLDALDAVARAGTAALETSADPRTAIIACYDAMERVLAEHGSARSAWETPTELLRRAAAAGLIRSPAAQRLTGLFEEARFSVHPLAEQDRQAALAALGQIRRESGQLTPAASPSSHPDRPHPRIAGSGNGASGPTT